MSAELRVGVAIPAHNRELLLADTLRSVLEQTHPVSDVVVVDDGSTDRTAEVALETGPPVRVVRQSQAGAGAARSHALRLVEGEVLLPLDADDLLTPHSIECRVAVLRARPEVDIVYGHQRKFTELSPRGPVPLEELTPAHVPDGMLVRRTAYERVGPFATHWRMAETLDWLLRARELGLREVTVPDQVLWRRVHGENLSLVARDSFGELAQAIKASLDRRRARSS